MDCSKHKGHRYYVNGPRDGEIEHLIFATHSDYPQTIGGVLRNGMRNWYELDYENSHGTEVVYRFIGRSKDFPKY